MNILFLDSSTEKLYAGLCKVKNFNEFNKINKFNLEKEYKLIVKNSDLFEIYQIIIDAGFKHTENIYEIVLNILNLGRLDNVSDIDLVVLGAGPGSFTGIRIAYSFIKGLLVNSDIKIIEIPSIFIKFISFVFNNGFISEDDIIVPLIFGKKKKFYGMIQRAKDLEKIFKEKGEINLIKDFYYFDFEIKNIFSILKDVIDKDNNKNIKLFFDSEFNQNEEFYNEFYKNKNLLLIQEEKNINLYTSKIEVDLERVFLFVLTYLNKIFKNSIDKIEPFYLREPDAYENLKKL
ncbi:MAG: hypothetical protein N3A58_06010 [Spirochaetes bacterium]|nr:hypothetical protein [Spirochaetota bacterium]